MLTLYILLAIITNLYKYLIGNIHKSITFLKDKFKKLI